MLDPQELLETEYPGLIRNSLQSVPVSVLELLAALSFACEEENDPDLIFPTVRAAFALGRWSKEREQ